MTMSYVQHLCYRVLLCLTLLQVFNLTVGYDYERRNRHMLDFQNWQYVNIDGNCDRQIDVDKSRCLRDSITAWDSVANREKAGCCLSWDLNDCILSAIYSKCDIITYKRIRRFLDQQNKEHSENLCSDYPYGSYKCHFPIWAIVLIVAFSLAIIIVIGFFVFMFCYQRRINKMTYF